MDVWAAEPARESADPAGRPEAELLLSDVPVLSSGRSAGAVGGGLRQVVVGVPRERRATDGEDRGEAVRGRAPAGPAARVSGVEGRVAVLLAAGAAAWEEQALELLAAPGRLVLLKRCLDLSDLLATAVQGSARVAVVSDQLPGLDADSLDRLNQAGVRTLVVTAPAPRRASSEDDLAARSRLLRMGASRVLAAEAVGSLPELVLATADEDRPIAAPRREATPPLTPGGAEDETSVGPGRLVVVWGPTGAPGRTTVATGIAAVAADAGRRVTLLDADPYGGAVGQHLAVLEDVSGLLSAVRLANGGELDAGRLAGLAREVAPRLRLLTGLPRPDRWTEVRTQAFHGLLSAAVELDEVVVVDTGFGLPSGPARPVRRRRAGRHDRGRPRTCRLDRGGRVGRPGGAHPARPRAAGAPRQRARGTGLGRGEPDASRAGVVRERGSRAGRPHRARARRSTSFPTTAPPPTARSSRGARSSRPVTARSAGRSPP